MIRSTLRYLSRDPRRGLAGFWYLTLCLVLGVAAPAGARDSVTVFAAASLKSALDEIVALHATSGVSPVVSYGGSSILARQIEQGAPADLFVSASPDWMDALQRGDRIESDTRVDLLTNRLVLIAGPDQSGALTVEPGFDLAARLGQGRLAMALVDAVPAGQYGQAALRSLGVWDAVRPSVAQADNVRAALMLVGSGEAPYGIVYATDATAEPRVHVAGTFPSDSHPPIVYPAALVKGRATPEARALLDFLRGSEAATVFRRHGFGVPGHTP